MLTVIWIILFLLTIIKNKSIKTKNVYCVLSIITGLFDFIIPMIYSALSLKIVSSIVSLAVLSLNITWFLKSIKTR